MKHCLLTIQGIGFHWARKRKIRWAAANTFCEMGTEVLNLRKLVGDLFGPDYFVTKSIYFDKPEASNWFVAYHQDLTISVNQRASIEGFDFWTVKQGQFAVQPPLDMLQDNFTVRIHLDDTDEHNGALNVIPQSHRKGIYRPETIDWEKETEVSCAVGQGGVMITKPLLLHSSGRTTNHRKRRVIHIEFSNRELPAGRLKYLLSRNSACSSRQSA